MIYRTLKQLLSIKSNDVFLIYNYNYYKIYLEYIKEIYQIIYKEKKVKIFNFKKLNNLDRKEKKFIITLEKNLYEKIKVKNKVLFLFSDENKASFLLFFYKYLKINKDYIDKNNLYSFNKEQFKNYLIHYQPHRCIETYFDRYTLFFGFLFFFLNKNFFNFKFVFSKKLLFKNDKYIFSKLYNYFFKFNEKFSKDIKFISKKLSDKKSKKIYLDIFKRPAEVWKNFYENLFEEEHYDFLKLKKRSIIINCGIAGGSELPFFLTQDPKLIINIDPDGKKNLLPSVKYFIKNFNNLIFVKKYLYGFDGKKYKEDKLVLSEYIRSKKFKYIDLIKSDIEGFEDQLIDDLPDIIKKYRPNLAISIYHSNLKEKNSIEQLIILPKKIFKVCKNYKFYIRHYSFSRKETVMYCIPK